MNNMCVYCGTSQGLQMHHIIYRSHGGSDEDDNLICLCWRHHAAVHDNPQFMIQILNSLKGSEHWRWDDSYNYLIATYG